MIRPRTIPTQETSAGIPIDVEIDIKADGAISRNGVQIIQEMQRPQTNKLIVGTKLYHLSENQFYVIVSAESKQFTIQRINDGTVHDATLKQLKQLTFICHERSGQ